jgi:hypothetical protein
MVHYCVMDRAAAFAKLLGVVARASKKCNPVGAPTRHTADPFDSRLHNIYCFGGVQTVQVENEGAY